MYSQNNEEEYILKELKHLESGRFLEIGAYHPTKFSNTRRLVEKGWRGVYVEPDPTCMETFRKEYSGNNAITLVEKAVMPEDGERKVKFYSSMGDAVGTTNEDHKEKWAKERQFSPITVTTIGVNELIEQVKATRGAIHFLNIDVEGENVALFNAIEPSVWLDPYLMLVCIEHDNAAGYMIDKLFEYGFNPVALNPENLIMGKPDVR